MPYPPPSSALPVTPFYVQSLPVQHPSLLEPFYRVVIVLILVPAIHRTQERGLGHLYRPHLAAVLSQPPLFVSWVRILEKTATHFLLVPDESFLLLILYYPVYVVLGVPLLGELLLLLLPLM
jgi:hypothetical protein